MNIALFAPVGAGKTTVLNLFAKHGWTTINQDELAHELLEENSAQIIDLFGDEILEDSLVSRKKLGAIVFADSSKRSALEGLLYPLIHTRTRSLMKGSSIVEGANLYKALDAYSFDKILTITVPLPLLKQRLLARGHSGAWINSVLAAQKPLFAAQSKADIVLSNAGSPKDLEDSVEKLIFSLH